MNILYFHQHFSTPSGAAGTRSYEMARRLVADGHTVTMVCGSYGVGKSGLDQPFRRGRRTGVIDGIRVVELNLSYSNADGFLKRSWLFSKYALASATMALFGRYDLAFATTTPLTAGIPGIVARWMRGKLFIFEVRDLWPELPRAMGVITNPVVLWLMSVLEWASYHSANRCIGLAPGIVDGIARRGVPAAQIALVPNGCDFELFGVDHAPPWRPDGVRETDLMAIFTGAHGIANGLDAVLDAAAVLKARGRGDIKLVLVGEGKLKPGLVDRAGKERLSNVVLHPAVDKRRLSGLMASADLGLQCLANIPAFYYGTSPNKFFDYIAAGLPVLVNYPGWIADQVVDHGCGYAVPPDDHAAFADALEKAADDRGALIRMGGNATKLAKSNFDRDRLAEDWMVWVIDGKMLARGGATAAGPASKLVEGA